MSLQASVEVFLLPGVSIVLSWLKFSLAVSNPISP